MANKVTIDVEARFIDNMTDGAQEAADSIKDIGDEAKKTKKETDRLGKEKVKPEVDANTNKFTRKIRDAEERAKRFGRNKTAAVLSAIDKASRVIEKATGKAKSFAGNVWSAIVKVKDVASDVLAKVKAVGKSIAGSTWSAIVKVKDMATAPLKKIKDSLFSIKTLIAGVAGGMAIKTAVAEPIGLADTIEGSRIAFENKLGSADAAESFLQDIYKFDEKSTFDTIKIVGLTQQMMNMGWNEDNALGDLGLIADWAATFNKGEDGIAAVIRALGQMRMKGKVSAEEMLQLTEAGVSGWQYLADHMGKDIGTIQEMAEDGLIDVDTAIKGIISGMEEYSGASVALADRTVSGLKDQISGLFKTYVALPWGEGLSEGFKDALVKVRDVIDENKDSLKAFGEELKEIGKIASGWFADKVDVAVDRIKEISSSEEFKNASPGGKIKMLWKGVVGNPLKDWWENTVVPWWDDTVVPWLAEKAEKLGEGLGSGITGGILALLGIDLTGAKEDGAEIGGSFLEGFLEGFDTEKITQALQTWAEENKGLATILGAGLGLKILSGIGGFVGNIRSLSGGGKGSGGSAGGLGDLATGTMNVTAGVVNISQGGLPGNNNTPDVDLPAGTGAGAGAAGAAGAGAKVGFFGKLFGSTGNAMVGGSGILGMLANAGYALTGGAAGSTLAGGTAAAIGGGSILGGILGVLGLGDGTIDFIEGSKLEKGSKERKDKMFQGGTKVGLVASGAGAGAGIGAAIGSLFGGVGAAPGALIGAGIGGLGALLGGDKLGKSLSDATDKGGWMNNAWQSTKGFFTESIPKAWNSMSEGISTFFTETIPEKWNELWTGVGDFFTETIGPVWENLKEKVSTFFTETIPEKWNAFWGGIETFFTETVPNTIETVKEKVTTFFTETIPEKWSEFWADVETFFTEKVPYAIGYVAGKIYAFFTETLPEKWGEFWESVGTFFTETLPTWAEGIWNDHIVPFFTETLPEFFSELWAPIEEFFTETIPTSAEGIWNDHIVPFFTETLPEFFGNLWNTIVEFFTETIPTWAEGIWNDHIVPFFTETLPQFFSDLWNSLVEFFTETIPTWAENTWNNNIVPFFTETIPQFFTDLWNNLVEFFTETIPTWADNIWNGHIVPFFTETIPGFFVTLWDSVTGFFNDSVDWIAENIWSPIDTFFTETIPGWVSSVWDKVTGWFNNIKDNFTAGFNAGSGGGGGGKKARGGYVGGETSSLEAFARGGMTGYEGIVGGSTRFIRVNEEYPEMVIPLSSQRRDRGLKLWAKTGELLGVPGFARGGRTSGEQDQGLRFHEYGSDDAPGGQTVLIEVGGITVEIHVDATGHENIAEAIKAQADEIAETMAGIMADAFGGIFENTPVRA